MKKEFQVIQTTMQQQSVCRADVTLGIGDDCALLEVPEHHTLAVTVDTMVEGVHFLLGTDARALGHKALAVSLSDLAAMGAEPAWATVALTCPNIDTTFLSDFRTGMFALAESFNVQLVGGDTTRGPLSITIQAHGLLPKDKGLRRSGAQVGDDIYVSGTLGGAAAGLAMLMDKPHLANAALVDQLHYPQPRVALGMAIREIAHAAIDVSDGLLDDLGHILQASSVGAELDAGCVPMPAPLIEMPGQLAMQYALAGGDDYELCFTAAVAHREELLTIAQKLNLPLAPIGKIVAGSGCQLHRDGKPVELAVQGFAHFS